MRTRKYTLVAACLLIMFAKTQDIFASDFYVDAGVMQMDAEINNTRHDPILARAKAGYYMTKNASIEVHVAATINKDKWENNKLSPSIVGLYLRYGSIASSRARAYVHLGVAHVALSTETSTDEFGETYNDISAGLGFEERLKHFKNASITLEYTRYHSQDNTPINGLTLGFRTDF